MNTKRRRNALSKGATDRSVVFIVPMTYTLSGMKNWSHVASLNSSAPVDGGTGDALVPTGEAVGEDGGDENFNGSVTVVSVSHIAVEASKVARLLA